jgi:membrane-associated phospholipid phosphatase|tara:strand:+ start:2612 stop:3058 length:447 start_codon:yes stop_codon:yes gene_type:complete
MKYSRFVKRASDESIRDFSALANPIILLVLFLLVFEGTELKIGIIGLIGVAVVCYIIKIVFNKERPLKIDHKNLFELVQSRSFPSAHSAIIMYTGLSIIAKVDVFLVDLLFGFLILVVGYSRYHLKKHFVNDIIWGYAIGLVGFILVF